MFTKLLLEEQKKTTTAANYHDCRSIPHLLGTGEVRSILNFAYRYDKVKNLMKRRGRRVGGKYVISETLLRRMIAAGEVDRFMNLRTGREKKPREQSTEKAAVPSATTGT